MSGLTGTASVTNCVTLNRATQLQIGVSEAVLTRPSWHLARQAEQIGMLSRSGSTASSTVALLSSGAWALRPRQFAEQFELVDSTPGQFFFIELLDVIAVNAIVARKMQRLNTEFFGVTYSPGLQGDNFLQKRVRAGESWNQELTADAAAFPKPTLRSANAPMDRVISGKEAFPENTGYCLRFHAPGSQLHTPDCLMTFYFGGETDTTTFGTKGGEHAASLYGDGTGELRERHAAGWTKLQDFRWSPPGAVAGRAHTLFFVPHDNDRMDIIAGAAEAAAMPNMFAAPRLGGPGGNPLATTIRPTAKVTGYNAKKAMVGPGTVRVDQRRDLRFPFQISWLAYPASGLLVDQPFEIPFPIPAGATIYLDLKGYTPTGTAISAQLYTANNDLALTKNPNGTFLAPGGLTSRYYAQFALTTTSAKRTPFLYGFDVYVLGASSEVTNSATTGGILRSVNISGPTGDPTQETAHVEIEDPKNELAVLRSKGRIHCRVRTRYDTNASNYSVLFEGELTRATATRKGKSNHGGLTGTGTSAFPAAAWRFLECPMVSMWARLQDQLAFTVRDFAADPAAGTHPVTGRGYRWKISDIISALFQNGLGIPADMLDIADVPTRAWISGRDSSEYLIQPGAKVIDFIQMLAKDHLGYYILWDPNAGTRGKWRLKPPPTSPYTSLWTFQTTHPGAGKLAHHPGSYAARTSFIQNYRSWVSPPEANHIIVTASGELMPNRVGITNITQWLYNPNSFSWTGAAIDTTHPDYLGRRVPLIYYNTLLAGDSVEETRAYTSLIARRLYQQVATCQKWIHFRAPLVLMTDSSDSQQTNPRPLRYYDAVTVDGNQFLVHSVTIDYTKDHAQMMDVEALAVDNSVTI